MNEDEKYLFDLMGYLVIPNALATEEVEACNQAIDHNIELLRERESSLAGGSEALAGTAYRRDMGGMLSWERPWCEPFRQLLVHAKVSLYLKLILGDRYRLDHGPSLIAMDRGTEGGALHGGGIERPNFSEAYFFKDGRIYCGLTVVEFMLADEQAEDGGLALIPGSHKANLACPGAMKLYQQYQQYVVKIEAKAGDAVIFTETLTHGTLPWKAKHQRRALLYKFSPGFQAYSQGAHQVTYPDYIEDMSPEERAVMEAPHIR
jgi:hypothetical protein